MSRIYSYMDAISMGYPGLGCHTTGDGTKYENIFLDSGGPIPSKAELDTWIKNATVVEMTARIKEERDRRKDTGGYKVGNNWYHSDSSSRIQQVSLMIAGAALPPNVMWKTMSGSYVLMTPALAVQIFQTAIGSDMALFAAAERKKAEMMASENPEDYNVLTGWPKIYGE